MAEAPQELALARAKDTAFTQDPPMGVCNHVEGTCCKRRLNKSGLHGCLAGKGFALMVAATLSTTASSNVLPLTPLKHNCKRSTKVPVKGP